MYLDSFPNTQCTVSFAKGDTISEGRILAVIERQNIIWLILDHTCAHPRDFRWPDQPADLGALELASGDIFHLKDVAKVLVCPQFMGIDNPVDQFEFFVDQEISFSKQHMPSGAGVYVGHGIAREVINFDDLSKLLGQNVLVKIDQLHRKELSLGHTLGHLFSYALNETTKPYWRKTVPLDDRGNPDFIGLSQVSSQVSPLATLDQYRLGKSFRKKGFNLQDFLNDFESIEEHTKNTLQQWLNQKPNIWMQTLGDQLGDSRVWHCKFIHEQFKMFCGGTHQTIPIDEYSLDLLMQYDEKEQKLRAHVRLISNSKAI